MQGATTSVFEKGERILEAGEIPNQLGVLLSGMVELCGTALDPNCGVLILTRGDLLVPTATLCQEPCLTSASALVPSRLMMLEREAVVRAASADARVAMVLARVTGAQWRMAVRHIIDLKSRSAAERLAAILLRFVDFTETGAPQLPFSRRTLAARLGVSRETLSRVIQVVADKGIVLRGSEIVVRDRRMAEEFSGPEPYPNRSERRLDVHAF
ncbi:MAG TPA: helix-turn-helix domain-containing protein [Nitrospira sp.]|nr:helix-turn-helix domain-containing protein [Nitrospira sp.]